MSSRPNRATVVAIRSRTVLSWSRSPVSARTSALVFSRICWAALSRSAFVRLQRATLAPSSARTSAHARPSPLLAPPTTATLPFSSRSMVGHSLNADHFEADEFADYSPRTASEQDAHRRVTLVRLNGDADCLIVSSTIRDLVNGDGGRR